MALMCHMAFVLLTAARNHANIAKKYLRSFLFHLFGEVYDLTSHCKNFIHLSTSSELLKCKVRNATNCTFLSHFTHSFLVMNWISHLLYRSRRPLLWSLPSFLGHEILKTCIPNYPYQNSLSVENIKFNVTLFLLQYAFDMSSITL